MTEREQVASEAPKTEPNTQSNTSRVNTLTESPTTEGFVDIEARPKSMAKSKWKEITMERVNTKAIQIGQHTFKPTGSCNIQCYVCGGYTNDKKTEDSACVCRECSLVIHRKCVNAMRNQKCLKNSAYPKSDYQMSPMKFQLMQKQDSPEKDSQSGDVVSSAKSKQASELATDDSIDGSASTERGRNEEKMKKMSSMIMESKKRNGHEFVNVACSSSQNKCMVCQIPVHTYLKSYLKCTVCNKYCHKECIPHNMLKCNAKENRTYISLSVEKHKCDESGEEAYDLVLKRLNDYEINKRANTRLRLSVWVNDRSRETKYEPGSQNSNVRTFLLREFLMPLQEIELNLDIRILKSELNDDDMLVVELQAVKQFAGPFSALRSKSAIKHDTESFRKCFSFSACQLEKDNLSGNFAFLDVENGLVCNMKMPIDEKLAANHNKDVEKEVLAPLTEDGEVQSDSDATSVEVVQRTSRPKSGAKASLIEKIEQKIENSDLIRNKNKNEKKEIGKLKRAAVKTYTASDTSNPTTIKDSNTDSIADGDQKSIESVDLKKLRDLELVGRGSYGIVFKCYDRISKKKLAVKLVEAPQNKTDDSYNDLMFELKINSKLTENNHCSIMNLVGAKPTQNWCVFVFPLMVCDLKTILQERKSIKEDDLRVYLMEIGFAVEFIHENNIIYRDLKPENTMLNEKGHIKICDFGISKLLEKRGQLTISCTGTPLLMSPQMFTYKGYSQEIDWWAFGILSFICTANCYIFSVENERTFVQELSTKKPDFSRGKFSKDLKDIIQSLLHKDPKRRLGYANGFHKIRKHKFFSSLKHITRAQDIEPVPIDDIKRKLERKPKKKVPFKDFKAITDHYGKGIVRSSRIDKKVMNDFFYFNKTEYEKF